MKPYCTKYKGLLEQSTCCVLVRHLGYTIRVERTEHWVHFVGVTCTFCIFVVI